ncbi:MAG: hypothetical protein NC818_06765 [Candidatus Omnitrophica bacterium]|nr:hypothetical protein [Candidatus Omnitrophota bacterium]
MPDFRKIEEYVKYRFPSFGINKKREVMRLIFEIAKRDNLPFTEIIPDTEYKDYRSLKSNLLKRRYPSFRSGNGLKLYLPDLELDARNRFKSQRSFKFLPKNIYVEREIKNSYLVQRFKEFFPSAKIIEIDSLKDYVKDKKFDIGEYNYRRDNIFIIRERYDFFKRCPCTKKSVSCGYNVLNLGVGCIYDCVYCYLQIYLKNTPGIVIPANLNDFFKKLPRNFVNSPLFRKPRLGNGEFSDSLALDDVTKWSLDLVSFFRERKELLFEFKTKSKNIDNLLDIKPANNIIISWSLNPQSIIDSLEFYTASLKERIASAKFCAEHGYRVGFHLDPLIYHKNWEDDYRGLLNLIFKNISKDKVAWISLGTLRFNPQLKKIIENRFPDNKILDEELFLGFDNKLRYHHKLRIMIYKKVYSWIKKRKRGIPVYLCMENRAIWKEVYGS